MPTWAKKRHMIPKIIAIIPVQDVLLIGKRLLAYLNKRKAAQTMRVGMSAPRNNRHAETPSGKNLARIDWPAGFGAFAITVKPPPATAPATTAYFSDSRKSGTSDARYVIAALSLKAVSVTAPKKRETSSRPLSVGPIHQP